MPEADRLEQATSTATDMRGGSGARRPGPLGSEVPEADAVEQSLPAAEQSVFVRAERPADVDEADWHDQQLLEPDPEDGR